MKQDPLHPLHMHNNGDLYVVMMQIGTVKGEPVFEPLGFGLPGQPSPEMLLRRGSRCTGFKSEKEAFEWLHKSAAKWNLYNLDFHRGKQIRIQKIEMYEIHHEMAQDTPAGSTAENQNQGDK